MTDNELAKEVARRLWAAEKAAKDANDAKLMRRLARVHIHLERAQRALPPAMGIEPQSGGLDKPPKPD